MDSDLTKAATLKELNITGLILLMPLHSILSGFEIYGTTRFCMVKGLISLNKKELRFDNFQIHKILLQLF